MGVNASTRVRTDRFPDGVEVISDPDAEWAADGRDGVSEPLGLLRPGGLLLGWLSAKDHLVAA